MNKKSNAKSKPLSLSTQIVRVLQVDDLHAIAGGRVNQSKAPCNWESAINC